jgi:CheY-like chemotaxis protein
MTQPRRRVLLVEDSDPVREVFRAVLGAAGFDVDTAQVASAAIERLAERRYAVVVADCFLPDLPAREWLAALRAAAPKTALIVYSGSVRPKELQRYAADVRAIAALERPFSPAQLLEAVWEACARRPGGDPGTRDGGWYDEVRRRSERSVRWRDRPG